MLTLSSSITQMRVLRQRLFGVDIHCMHCSMLGSVENAGQGGAGLLQWHWYEILHKR